MSLIHVADALKGPPMGEPVAFASLPLISTYCYVKSHGHRPKRSSMVNCGDDSQFRTTKQKSARYNYYLGRLGSCVSEKKDHLHPNKGVFVELISKNGTPSGAVPFAPAFSTSTGKSECNYFTVSTVMTDISRRLGGRKQVLGRILENSRYNAQIKHCARFGIPINNPIQFCGLSAHLPGFDDNRAKRFAYSYASNIPIGGSIDPACTVSWSNKTKTCINIITSVVNEIRTFVNIQGDEVYDPEVDGTCWSFESAVEQRCSSLFAAAALEGSAALNKERSRPLVWELSRVYHRSIDKWGVSELFDPKISLLLLENDRKRPVPYFRPEMGDDHPLGIGKFVKEYHITRGWSEVLMNSDGQNLA